MKDIDVGGWMVWLCNSCPHCSHTHFLMDVIPHLQHWDTTIFLLLTVCVFLSGHLVKHFHQSVTHGSEDCELLYIRGDKAD